jgi:serine/threonine-protein kinase
MAIVSSGTLIDVLRQNDLLSAQQCAEISAVAGGRCAAVAAIAKTLVQRGWFTVYQINQILAGHAKDLVLGPYRILDRLGKGGQSEVYKAYHPENKWTVALKVVRSDRAPTKAANRFLAEMAAMAELEHPNVVEFWDVDKVEDAYYCAMEFVEGTDLGKVVRLQGCLPPAQASEYIRQTALGLQHAHEHNLVHRDIKPVNLLLTNHASQAPGPVELEGAPNRRGQLGPPLIKILDWGLANLKTLPVKGEQAQENAQPDNVIGTADYLSPEQALNPHDVDIRGDIYSLGCTFYYLLTGQTPFKGTLMEKILQHQKAVPIPVEQLNPEVAAGVAKIVRRMMAKSPAERFQTPAAAALALTPFCRGNPSPTLPAREMQRRSDVERGRPQEDTKLPSTTMPAS